MTVELLSWLALTLWALTLLYLWAKTKDASEDLYDNESDRR